MDEVYSVLISWPPASPTSRLGPYFSLQSARNQASRAKNKGALILGIDKASVEWKFYEGVIDNGSD